MPVMVDTGATISCLLSHGFIMNKYRPKQAAVYIKLQLADDTTIYLDKIVHLPLKPKGAKESKEATFYLQNNCSSIFGYEAGRNNW